MIEMIVALRAFIDSFESYTINSLIKKKLTYFIMSLALFKVAQPNKNNIEIIFPPTSLRWPHFLWGKFFSKLFLQSFFSNFLLFTIISHHYF